MGSNSKQEGDFGGCHSVNFGNSSSYTWNEINKSLAYESVQLHMQIEALTEERDSLLLYGSKLAAKVQETEGCLQHLELE